MASSPARWPIATSRCTPPASRATSNSIGIRTGDPGVEGGDGKGELIFSGQQITNPLPALAPPTGVPGGGYDTVRIWGFQNADYGWNARGDHRVQSADGPVASSLSVSAVREIQGHGQHQGCGKLVLCCPVGENGGYGVNGITRRNEGTETFIDLRFSVAPCLSVSSVFSVNSTHQTIWKDRPRLVGSRITLRAGSRLVVQSRIQGGRSWRSLLPSSPSISTPPRRTSGRRTLEIFVR
jgi:hypothetical protein